MGGTRDAVGPTSGPAAPGISWLAGVRFGASLTIAAVAAYAFVRLLGDVRGPATWVLIGVLVAIALDPLVDKLSRLLHVGRAVAVALVLLAAGAVIAGMVISLAPRAVERADDFTTDLPELVDGLRDLPVIGSRIEPDTADRLTRWLEELPDRLGTDEGALARGFQSIADGVIVAAEILIVLIAALLDGPRLARWARRQLPQARREQAAATARIASDIIGRYFAGSLIIAVLNGTLMLIVGLILGVPLIPFVAVWAMITNLIPQIGGFLGGSVFVVLGLSHGPVTGVLCLAWFLLYQQVENHVIQPAIVGEAVDISPAGTMLAALIGGAALGVPGAMIAIPFIATVKALYLFQYPSRAEPEEEDHEGGERADGERADGDAGKDDAPVDTSTEESAAS